MVDNLSKENCDKGKDEPNLVPKCEVCKEPASLTCLTCHFAHYCCVEHRTSGWKFHVHKCYTQQILFDWTKNFDILLERREETALRTLSRCDDILRESFSRCPIFDKNAEETVAIRKSPLFPIHRDRLQIQSCRKCSTDGCYRFQFDDELPNNTVRILCGLPNFSTKEKYKAISFVWGNPITTNIFCSGCNYNIAIPLESPEKFLKVMQLAGPGSTIWWDILSIDQSDSNDMARQIAAMGEIYANAETVSVLLPSSDRETYHILCDLTLTTAVLLAYRQDFIANEESRIVFQEQNVTTSDIARKYFELLQQFSEKIRICKYWQRAWTFQEWAQAKDIEFTLEYTKDDDCPMFKFKNLKTSIVTLGILMADYHLVGGQYCKIRFGFSRGFALQKFDLMKQLFPLESMFLSPNDTDLELYQKQAFAPGMYGTDQLLGIRLSDKKYTLLTRLNLMLSAFGTSERDATFEADLVACWASMCSISYHYVKEESFELALRKVISSLQLSGIHVYSFMPKMYDRSTFFHYSKRHRQSNATNHSYFVDLPIFSGRTDTIAHLNGLLTQSTNNSDEDRSIISLYKVKAKVLSVTKLSDDINNLSMVVQQVVFGIVDYQQFTDIHDSFLNTIKEISIDQRMKFSFVVIKVDELKPEKFIYLWTIVSSEINLKDAFIARENLNGTLVLALPSSNQPLPRIIGFPIMTDQQCGSYLFKSDEIGRVHIDLLTPLRSDIYSNGLVNRRIFTFQLEFDLID